MGKIVKVTQTQIRCLRFMQQNGAEIHRHPGGYWSTSDWRHNGISFGTSTIEGLSKRGLIKYTEWKKHGHGDGQFPIKAEIATTQEISSRMRVNEFGLD